LAAFPLIRSYTTESVPPHTLVVTIVERQPVGVVDNGSDFAVVDPAGVVIETVDTHAAGLPLIQAGDASIGNPAFASAVEVLLALPPDLLARVDSISATTKDDVTLLLVGDLQSVAWGSADRSAFKARVLATLVTTQPASAHVEFDISAPDAPVVRAR
jgi:cell division protein FtsQ